MASSTLLVLVTLCVSSSLSDVNVTDYIYWKKSDIKGWHEFFPLRALDEELLTLKAWKVAISNINDNMNSSLPKLVEFQDREYQTAQLLMNGTDAQGCIMGLSDYMSRAIADALSTFNDCIDDAESKYIKFNKSLSSTNSTYWAAYQRALSGIDVCQKTYPNMDSYQRLISCVQSMFDNYMKVANSTQNSVFPSPSMSYFQTTVVGCASDAANSVTAKGYKFLEMLVGCAALVPEIDVDDYKQELSKWKGNNVTLSEQIKTSQTKNYEQVGQVENNMTTYYILQKEALEKYVIQSRGLDYYLNKIYSLLQDYYNTVTSTTLDNPGDNDCTTTAKKELDDLASSTAYANLACDMEVVKRTIEQIDDVQASFQSLDTEMPSIGNVAILNCFIQGYVFAPNTVADCFNLKSSDFDADYEDQLHIINRNVAVLSEFEKSFYNADDLPCGGTTLKRLLLGGDIVLYDLQRCLYYTSGTTYAVTTPIPYTTTTASSSTTPTTTTNTPQ